MFKIKKRTTGGSVKKINLSASNLAVIEAQDRQTGLPLLLRRALKPNDYDPSWNSTAISWI